MCSGNSLRGCSCGPYSYRRFNCNFCDSGNQNSGNGNNTNSDQTITVFSGSDLRLNFKFPFSVSDKTLSVVSSNNTALDNPTIERVDDFNLLVTWLGEDIKKLPLLTRQRIRMGLTFADGSQKNYNNIWIIAK